MTLPTLPQTLIPAISFLAWFAVNWLKHSTLPTWANALIALLVPLFTAILWAVVSNAFTATSFWGNIAIIVVLCYIALALPELASWRQWLQETFQSPFASLARRRRVVIASMPASATLSDPAITAPRLPAVQRPEPRGIDLSTVAPAPRPPQYLDSSLRSRPIVEIKVPVQPTQPPAQSQNTEPPVESKEEPSATEQPAD